MQSTESFFAQLTFVLGWEDARLGFQVLDNLFRLLLVLLRWQLFTNDLVHDIVVMIEFCFVVAFCFVFRFLGEMARNLTLTHLSICPPIKIVMQNMKTKDQI